jgi:hypothetical protein
MPALFLPSHAHIERKPSPSISVIQSSAVLRVGPTIITFVHHARTRALMCADPSAARAPRGERFPMGGLHTTWPFPFALVLARALLLVLLCSECSATNVYTGEAVSELHAHASPGSHSVRESQRAVACVHAPIASHVVVDGDVLHQGASRCSGCLRISRSDDDSDAGRVR